MLATEEVTEKVCQKNINVLIPKIKDPNRHHTKEDTCMTKTSTGKDALQFLSRGTCKAEEQHYLLRTDVGG